MTTVMQHETTPATKPAAISDRALHRMIKLGAIALAVLTVAFSVIYYLGQRVDSGPSLIDRQVAAAEDAVKAAPQKVANRIALAGVYLEVGRLDDAVTQYNEVLKAVPGNTGALMGKGMTLIKQGDLDAASTIFTKLTAGTATGEFAKIDPQREAAFFWLASIAQQQGKLDLAIKNAQTALSMDDADADAWNLLGTVQTAKGDPKSGVESITRALAFVPTGWCEPYTSLRDAYTKLGQAEMAEYSGAMSDFCGKSVDSARSRLEKLTSGPAAVPAMTGLGLIAETASDRDTAVNWYQKAIAKDPSNASARTALVRLGVSDSKTAGTTTEAK